MKKKYLDFEKHICVCGEIMEYDGIETVVIRDDIDEETAEDLSVYICPKCDYKIWLIAPMYSNHIELSKKLRKVVWSVLKKYRTPIKRKLPWKISKE